jgi:putative flippase GtrA
VSPLVIRWLKFNSVGAMGVVVQLALLVALKEWARLGYLAATVLAVEGAVLHNFVWHERFTWKERAGGPAGQVLARLLRFHLGNGLISIAGNLALMRLLVGWWHVNYLAANIATIAICSAANFVAGEWFVFRRK